MGNGRENSATPTAPLEHSQESELSSVETTEDSDGSLARTLHVELNSRGTHFEVVYAGCCLGSFDGCFPNGGLINSSSHEMTACRLSMVVMVAMVTA